MSLSIRAGLYLCLCGLLAAGCGKGRRVVEDTWMATYLMEKQVGYSHSVVEEREVEGLTVFEVTEVETLSLLRMGTLIVLEEVRWSREDKEGKILAFKSEEKTGGAKNVISGRLESGGLVVKTGGREMRIPYPEGAVGTWAAQRKIREAGVEEGIRTEVSLFDERNPGVPFTMINVVGGKAEKEVLGSKRVLISHDITLSHMPGLSMVAWTDEAGKDVLIETEMMAMGKVNRLLVSKEAALGEVHPQEFVAQSLVIPDRPMPDPHHLEEVVFLVSAKNGGALKFARDAMQEVEVLPEGYQVTVRMPVKPHDEEIFRHLPVQGDGLERYLAASVYLQSDDDAVRNLAREIQGDEQNALVLAGRIEKEIHGKIKEKSLEVGFASAAEVAKSLEGDCSEHAVLCAAVARAMGLPSRVASGLVYAPPNSVTNFGKAPPAGMFGFHMWAEVLVAPGVWWPVDAAAGGFDPGHLAVSKTDLSQLDPESEISIPLMQIISNIDIKILSVSPKKADSR